MLATAEQTIWAPQPGPQHALMYCPLPIVFFGGARGGGKTDGVLGKWGAKAVQYKEHFNAIAFRKTTVSFDDAVERAKQIYQPLGFRFSMSNNRPQFTTPWGGRIAFRYLEDVSDADQYQGRNITDAWVEEVGQYANSRAVDRLFGILRSAARVPVQLILTGNPGGAGQHWLRARFHLHPFPEKPLIVEAEINALTIKVAVIPSRLRDNKILLESDPEYQNRLQGSGSKELVRAWLDGDWSAIEGAFFSEWDQERHVLKPFEIPGHWTRFRSLDWGFAAPFSVGWWAVASEATEQVPKGAMVRYREWYGASKPGEGIRLTAEELAYGILEREDPYERISYSVADPSMWQQNGGPSLAERMWNSGVDTRRADNTRIGKLGAVSGWDQIRARLRGDIEGRPMLAVFDTCTDFIRTVPLLQHDPRNPEDLDTDSEDHVADETRYACLSRPYMTRAPAPPDKPVNLNKVIMPRSKSALAKELGLG